MRYRYKWYCFEFWHDFIPNFYLTLGCSCFYILLNQISSWSDFLSSLIPELSTYYLFSFTHTHPHHCTQLLPSFLLFLILFLSFNYTKQFDSMGILAYGKKCASWLQLSAHFSNVIFELIAATRGICCAPLRLKPTLNGIKLLSDTPPDIKYRWSSHICK